MNKSILLSLTLLLMSWGLNAQTATTPALGDGTSGNPYQIATLGNLYWITVNSSTWNSYFIQTASIDASGTEFWSSGGWTPIGDYFANNGSEIHVFAGHYDGQGHNISGLHINNTSFTASGLFGCISGASIINLGVIDVHISAWDNTGALAGYAGNAIIYNCHSTGNVSGTRWVAGLTGTLANSSMTNCFSTCNVTGASDCVGGLSAYNNSTITYCYYSNGTVTTTGRDVGGLVGFNTSGGSISKCYSTGTVNGLTNVGGLVGYNFANGIIDNCFSKCTCTATTVNNYQNGGLVGSNESSTITNCYSTGIVGLSVGGLVGWSDLTAVINSFWDTETSGGTWSHGGTGLTTAEMVTQSTFTDAGWDFTNIWGMDAGFNDGYPFLIPAILTLSSGSNLQTSCAGSPITPVVYSVGGFVTAVTFSVDPASGLSGIFDQKSKKFTVSGTITDAGSYSFSANTTSNLTLAPATEASVTGTITVNSLITPSVTISSNDADNKICNGTLVTFTAKTANTGNGTVSYQWKRNDENAGDNQTTFATTELTEGDRVSCSITITGSSICLSSTTAVSNEIVNHIFYNEQPLVTITSDLTGTVCSTAGFTFTALPENTGGGIVSYAWKLNGSPVGPNANKVYLIELSDEDVVNCEITVTNAVCYASATATSNDITIDLFPLPDAGEITGNNLIRVGESTSLSSSVPGGLWISFDLGIAMINGSGVVTGTGTGTTTILYGVKGGPPCYEWSTTEFPITVTSAPGIDTQTFTGSGEFTVPEGVYSIEVRAWGGGGGGSYRYIMDESDPDHPVYGPGAGGGGGGYCGGKISVSPGEILAFVVGTGGGSGNSYESNGVAGEGSRVESNTGNWWMTASGGSGGSIGAGGAEGGVGGCGTFNPPTLILNNFTGGNGSSGKIREDGFGTGGGGGGGAGDAQNGQPGTSETGGAGGEDLGGKGGDSGNLSEALGGGGGGANNDESFVDGFGAPGLVIFQWANGDCIPPTPTFTESPASPQCQATEVTYTTQAGKTNYVWIIQGVENTDYIIISGGTSTDPAVSLMWLTDGSKTVTVNYTEGCEGEIPASSTIIFNPPPTATITGPAEIKTNETTTLSPASGGHWTSSDEAVATVTDEGVVTGTGSGTASFTFTDATTGCSATTGPVTVNDCSDGTLILTTDNNEQTVCMDHAIENIVYSIGGGAGSAEVTGLPEGVGWISDNGEISISGIPTVSGTFDFTVSTTGTAVPCQDATASGTITVSAPPYAGTIKGTDEICIGETLVFKIDGDEGGTWASSNEEVVYVDATGTVEGKQPGTATIKYTVNGTGGCAGESDFAEFAVTVKPLPHAGNILGNNAICIGGATTLTSDGDQDGTWSSDDENVATVSQAGEVDGWAAGTATITYSVQGTGGCFGEEDFSTLEITVTAPPHAGNISGNNMISTEETTQLSVTGNSGEGTWASTNTEIATIDASGIVSGVSPGIVTITYTVNGTGGCGNDIAEFLVEVSEPQNQCIGSAVSVRAFVDPDNNMTPQNATGEPDDQFAAIGNMENVQLDLTGGSLTLGDQITINMRKGPGDGNAFVVVHQSQTGQSWTVASSFNVTSDVFTGYSVSVSENTRYISIENISSYWLYVESVTYHYPCPECTDGTLTLMSGNDFQPVCLSTAVADIVYTTGGSVTGATVIGLPDGTGGVFDSGTFTISGTPLEYGTFNYTVTTTGTEAPCIGATATGTIIVNPLPVATISYNESPYCGTGIATVTQTGQAGGTYSSAIGLSVNAATGEIDLGSSLAGTYTVTYNFSDGSCSNITEAAVTIHAIPDPPGVGTITQPTCSFATGSVALTGLPESGTWTVTGTGNTGTVTETGEGPNATITGLTAGTTYTFTVTVWTGCTSLPSDNVDIIPQPETLVAPSIEPQVFCGSAIVADLPQSSGTETYQWYDKVTTVKALKGSTKLKSATYYVSSTSGSCESEKTPVTVLINPIPTAFYVTGGGTYCTSGTSFTVQLSGSETGINYQLYLDGSPVDDAIVSGTGTAISFKDQELEGTYTVIAINAATGCQATMQGCAVIKVSTPPMATDIVYSTNESDNCRHSGKATVISLIATPGGSFSSTPCGLSIDPSNGDINFTKSNPGQYSVTYTVSNPCGTAEISTTITVTKCTGKSAEGNDDEAVFITPFAGMVKAYPNPFVERVNFEFVSPEDTHVMLEMFDMTGRKVQTIFDNNVEGGEVYKTEFTTYDNAGGIYLYRLIMGNVIYNGKVICK